MSPGRRVRRTWARPRAWCATVLAGCTLLLACAPGRWPHLAPVVQLPVGAPAPRDVSRAFAGVFCSVLERESPAWGPCASYLEPAGVPGALPPLPSDLRVVVIPGLMAPCFGEGVRTFGEGLDRLASLGIRAELVPVSGLGGTTFNGRQIVAWLRARIAEEPDARFVLVGFSKGAADALEALALEPALARNVAALVTVAGAIGGSPIPEQIPDSLKKLGVRLAPGRCEKGDGQALASLSRRARLEFLARHPAPPVPSYSLSAVSRPETTSRVFLRARGLLDRISVDNDGQLLAADAIVPGSAYLGSALGDHLAVAVQFNRPGLPWSQLVDRNRYPRAALLEALLRFVGADLSHGRVLDDAPAVGGRPQDDEGQPGGVLPLLP